MVSIPREGSCKCPTCSHSFYVYQTEEVRRVICPGCGANFDLDIKDIR